MGNRTLKHSAGTFSVLSLQAGLITGCEQTRQAMSLFWLRTTSVKLQQGRNFSGGRRIEPSGSSPKQAGFSTCLSRYRCYPNGHSISLLPAPTGYSQAKHHPQLICWCIVHSHKSNSSNNFNKKHMLSQEQLFPYGRDCMATPITLADSCFVRKQQKMVEGPRECRGRDTNTARRRSLIGLAMKNNDVIPHSGELRILSLAVLFPQRLRGVRELVDYPYFHAPCFLTDLFPAV